VHPSPAFFEGGGRRRRSAPRSSIAVLLAALGGVAGCRANDADPPDANESGGCWGASVDTLDAASLRGCTPRGDFTICQPPPPATVIPDGDLAAADGAYAGDLCGAACGVDEYALQCYETPPDPALRCTRIPLRFDAVFYCCPCPLGSPP
jgi:hypothetical protein